MKALIFAALAVASTVATAADPTTINRLPYNLDCADHHRDGGKSTLSLSKMAFYREDGKLYFNADLSTTAKDQIVSSYIDHLTNLIRLEGLEQGSNVKYKLISITPSASRLEAGKSYQIKLEIINAKGDPVDVRCVQ